MDKQKNYTKQKKEPAKNPIGRQVRGDCDLPALRVFKELRDKLQECAEFEGILTSDARRLALEDWIEKTRRRMNRVNK